MREGRVKLLWNKIRIRRYSVNHRNTQSYLSLIAEGVATLVETSGNSKSEATYADI